MSLTRLPALLLCRISPFGAFIGQPAYAQALISAGVPTIYVSVSSEKSTIMPTDAMSEQHSNKSIITNTPLSEKSNEIRQANFIDLLYHVLHVSSTDSTKPSVFV